MLKWFIVNVITLLLLARFLPGFEITQWQNAVIAVLVIGLINITIKPILKLLTFPITILTLGLFSWIINALMLMLAARLTDGFNIDGFLTALIAALLLSIITSLLNQIGEKS
ncbi:MAG: phage holin family protein [bacterium]|nr:phage holin family protein [bacterium]